MRYFFVGLTIIQIFLFVSCSPTSLENKAEKVLQLNNLWEVHNVLVYKNDVSQVGPELKYEYRNCGDITFFDSGQGVYSYDNINYIFNWDLEFDGPFYNGTYLYINYEDTDLVRLSFSPYLYYLSHTILSQNSGFNLREDPLPQPYLISVTDSFIFLKYKIFKDGIIELYLTPKEA